METLKKMMLTRNKALLIGLCCLWLVALVTIVKGVNECGPDRWDPRCDEWSVCVPYLDSQSNYQNFCVEINDCSDHNGLPCHWGEVCCGHGPQKCMCPWPRLRNKKGECVECDCDDEICTLPHGECACGNSKVRNHNGECVDCDPTYNCPDCPPDKICQRNSANNGMECVCRPEFVENPDNGECTWCQACPASCPSGQLCVRTGLGEATCECPPGFHKLPDNSCEETPYCDPECTDGKWCVVRNGNATCECPSGHIPHGSGCMYLPTPKVLPKHNFDYYGSGSGSGSGGWV